MRSISVADAGSPGNRCRPAPLTRRSGAARCYSVRRNRQNIAARQMPAIASEAEQAGSSRRARSRTATTLARRNAPAVNAEVAPSAPRVWSECRPARCRCSGHWARTPVLLDTDMIKGERRCRRRKTRLSSNSTRTRGKARRLPDHRRDERNRDRDAVQGQRFNLRHSSQGARPPQILRQQRRRRARPRSRPSVQKSVKARADPLDMPGHRYRNARNPPTSAAANRLVTSISRRSMNSRTGSPNRCTTMPRAGRTAGCARPADARAKANQGRKCTTPLAIVTSL